MIQVKMCRRNRDMVFSVIGHAGYSQAEGLPAGCDIVCAAASILADTFLERMYELREKGSVAVADVKREDGCVRMCVREEPRPEVTEFAGTVRTVAAGYALLADRYPQYVRLEADGWVLGATDPGGGGDLLQSLV